MGSLHVLQSLWVSTPCSRDCPGLRGAIEQLALRGAGLHAEVVEDRAWHLAAHFVAPGPVTVSLGSACAEQGQGSVGWGHAQSTVPNPLIFDERRPPAAHVPEPWPLLSIPCLGITRSLSCVWGGQEHWQATLMETARASVPVSVALSPSGISPRTWCLLWSVLEYFQTQTSTHQDFGLLGRPTPRSGLHAQQPEYARKGTWASAAASTSMDRVRGMRRREQARWRMTFGLMTSLGSPGAVTAFLSRMGVHRDTSTAGACEESSISPSIARSIS